MPEGRGGRSRSVVPAPARCSRARPRAFVKGIVCGSQLGVIIGGLRPV